MSLNVGHYATLDDRHSEQQLIQFLVVADCQLKMTGNYSRLLVVASGVSCQFEHFGGQVLDHCGEVDGRSGSDTLGVVSFAEKAMYTPNTEVESCATRPGDVG